MQRVSPRFYYFSSIEIFSLRVQFVIFSLARSILSFFCSVLFFYFRGFEVKFLICFLFILNDFEKGMLEPNKAEIDSRERAWQLASASRTREDKYEF